MFTRFDTTHAADGGHQTDGHRTAAQSALRSLQSRGKKEQNTVNM